MVKVKPSESYIAFIMDDIQTPVLNILSWNINGIRASKKHFKELIDILSADVICLQETKITRDQLDENTAVLKGHNSYYSFSRKRSGYSGVATVCKDNFIPIAAEEGLTGCLSNQFPSADSIGHYGDLSEFTDEELQDLDKEGRAILTKHVFKYKNNTEAFLCIINVYCPRYDPEKPERRQFKLNFYKLLQIRAEAILASGCHVIIVGDVNAAHHKIDSCCPEEETDFKNNPSRKWLNQFLIKIPEKNGKPSFKKPKREIKEGSFVDTFRYFHPTQTEAYTCWSTVTGARQTNYGRRIDYIFADLKIVERCFKNSTILPHVEGSDHCPVMAEVQCFPIAAEKCPSICTKYWPEFAGKQQTLSCFLTKCASGNTNNLNNSKDSLKSPISHSVKSQQKSTKKQKTKSNSQKSMDCFLLKSKKETNKVVLEEKQIDGNSEELFPAIGEKKQTDFCDTETTTEGVDTKNKLCEESSNCLSNSSSVMQWKQVFRRPDPLPLCSGHKEPSVLRTVKKPGPNFRRQFYTCALPEGPKTDPRARCNFFKWVTKK